MLNRIIAILVFTLIATTSIAKTNIIMFGDSLTAGYGLFEHDALVHQMGQSLLSDGYDVVLGNAGISGDTTTGGLERLDWYAQDYYDIIVLALGGNDALRGVDPKLMRSNLDKMLEMSVGKGLRVVFVGTYAPSNYGDDYKQEFDAVFPDLAAKYNVSYVDSFYSAFMDPENPELSAASEFLQPDMLHPNELGVKMIVKYLKPYIVEHLTN